MNERQKLEKLEAIVEDLEEKERKKFYEYKGLIIRTNRACREAKRTNDPKCWDTFNTTRRRRNSAKADLKAIEAKHEKYEKRYKRKKDRCETAIKAANEALGQFCSWYGGRLRIENTKIVFRNDGKTDVFYGGEYKAGDGEGHGHAVVDDSGVVVYLRDTWQKHGRALIDDAKKGRNNMNYSQ